MAPVTIMIRNNGPYQVEGDFTLVTAEGVPVPTTPGKPVKLCRCGASTKKPFCDGMHSKIGFQGAQAAQESFDARKGTDAVPGAQQPGVPKTDPSSGT